MSAAASLCSILLWYLVCFCVLLYGHLWLHVVLLWHNKWITTDNIGKRDRQNAVQQKLKWHWPTVVATLQLVQTSVVRNGYAWTKCSWAEDRCMTSVYPATFEAACNEQHLKQRITTQPWLVHTRTDQRQKLQILQV